MALPAGAAVTSSLTGPIGLACQPGPATPTGPPHRPDGQRPRLPPAPRHDGKVHPMTPSHHSRETQAGPIRPLMPMSGCQGYAGSPTIMPMRGASRSPRDVTVARDELRPPGPISVLNPGFASTCSHVILRVLPQTGSAVPQQDPLPRLRSIRTPSNPGSHQLLRWTQAQSLEWVSNRAVPTATMETAQQRPHSDRQTLGPRPCAVLAGLLPGSVA